MAAINNLYLRIDEIHKIYEEKKTAEKAKVLFLTDQAAKLFDECYKEFNSLQVIQNTSIGNERSNLETTVMLAEAAFYTDNIQVSRSLVERFLQLNPQKDQFYCRIKILLGQLIHAENVDKNSMMRVTQCKRATGEIMQALDVALLPNNLARYKFIVYNASLAFWSIAREFVRPNRGQHFASDFNKVVGALEQQDDTDKYWRILMLSSAAICADDEKNMKNAGDFMDKAISLMEGLLTITTGEETQMVKVSDACKAEVDAAMNAFRAIEEREELMRKPRKIDPDLPDDDEYYTKPLEFPPLQGLAARGFAEVKGLLDDAQRRKADIEAKLRTVVDRKSSQTEYLVRLYRERIALAPVDAKKILALPQVTKDLRLFCMVQLQCILSGVVAEKEIETTWTTCIKKLQDAPVSESRSETLLDFARATWQLNQVATAKRCMELMQQSTQNITRILRTKLDVCEAQLNLYSIDTVTQEAVAKQLLSNKQVEGFKASKRLEAIKILERTLSTTASVVEDKFLVYEMCAILWNASIPFLSKRLRTKVHPVLRAIATAFEDLSADAMPLLRAQVHYELALAEEAADFAGIALVEVQRAYRLDYGSTNEANPNDAVRPLNSDLLNLNRVSDQYLTPFLKSLELRIDVYASPSEAESQAILWLQQAKESTSKPFIKDMITKVASLVLDEIDVVKNPETATNHSGVDWSLVMMKKGKITIPSVSVQTLNEMFLPTYATLQSQFTYTHQRYFNILANLARIAFSVQDADILAQAYCRMSRFTYTVTDVFAYEFIDQQIEIACKFAESMLWRLQSLGKTSQSTLFQANVEAFALGIQVVVPDSLVTLKIDTTEIAMCKTLAIQALDRALSLALARKDAYNVHNVLIYFWNLHVHVFRRQLYPLLLEECFAFLKTAVNTAESLLSFPGAKDCCDVRLWCNYYESLSMAYENRTLMNEALDIATKGTNVTFPTLANASTGATYFKKTLAERAARLSVQNAVSGVVAVDAKGGKGKGGAGAVGSLEPLVFAENVWLSFFAATAVAEFYQTTSLTIPKESLVAALDKAVKLLATEVPALVQKELEAEAKGQMLRTKEGFDQRLELQLESYARLSRLKSLHGEYIASQDFAESALTLFAQEQVRVYGRRLDPCQVLNHHEEMKELLSTRAFRWTSCCELSMALAVVSFLESAQSAAGVSTLDEGLIRELQCSALNHLRPAIAYASWSREEDLLQRATSIVAQILPSLLTSAQYFRAAIDTTKAMLYDELTIIPRSKALQQMMRGVYLALIAGLIAQKYYDEGLKVIMHAFEKLDSEFQKELWPGRVICMSKKGMNVLDGLQKLKESDPVLQAQVLVLFARSSKVLASKLSGYQQALEVLDNRIERVDYLVELAEVLSASGFARPDITAILQEGFSVLCGIEERLYEEILDWEDGEESPYPDIDLRDLDIGGATVPVERTGTTIRAASVASKSRRAPSEAGKGTSRAPSASQQQSATSIASRGSTRGPGSVAPSQRTSNNNVNTRKSATSLATEALIEANTLPTRLTLQTLELASRISIMRCQTDVQQDAQVAHGLQAFYFLQRGMETWFEALKDTFKRAQHAALAPEIRATTPLDTFVVEQYPAFLEGWNLESDVATIICTWNGDEALRDYSWQQINLHKSHSSTAEAASFAPTFLQDVPSTQSMPTFSATVYNVYTLIELFVQWHMPYHALLTIKILRLWLWALPVVTPSTEDRNAALLALHATYQHVLLQLRVHSSETKPPIRFADETFLMDVEGKAVHPGDFLRDFLLQLQAKHVREDLSETQKIDLLFRDLTAHSPAQQAQQQETKYNPFQIDVTNVTFASLIKVESEYFWLRSLRVLLNVGQFALVENLLVSFMWEQRACQSRRYLLEASLLYLDVLLLRGQCVEVVAHLLALKPLLDAFGDVRLLQEAYHILVQAYESLGQSEEAYAVAQLLQHLLEDLAVRQLAKVDGQSVQVTAILAQKLHPELMTRKGSQTMMQSTSYALDEEKGGGVGGGLGSSTSLVRHSSSATTSLTLKSAAGPSSSNAPSRKPWTTQELGLDYLCAWVANVKVLVRLDLTQALQRIHNVSLGLQNTHRNVAASDILEGYQRFCTLLRQAIDVLKDLCGERALCVLELLTLRAEAARRFLMALHKDASRALHLDDYDMWFTDNLTMVVDYHHEVVLGRQYWSQRLDLPANTVEDQGNATDVSIPAANTTETSGEVQTLSFASPFVPPTPPPATASSRGVVPSILRRQLGEAQLQKALAQWLLAFHRGDHLSPTNFDIDPATQPLPSAIDTYLHETDQHLIDSPSLFVVHTLGQVLALCDAAQSSLAEDLIAQNTARMLWLIAQLAQCIHRLEFDTAWQQHATLPTSSLQAIQARCPEALQWQEELYQRVQQCIDRHLARDEDDVVVSRGGGKSLQEQEVCAYALVVLLESRGCVQSATAVSCLLQLQSLRMKTWLSRLWQRSVNTQSDIGVALRRLQRLQAQGFVNVRQIPAVKTEERFLQTFSPAYRRLSIAPEPFLILQQHALVTTHRPTLHLVLQTCPLQETLYLGAGYLGSSSDLENPALFLGGAGGVAGGAAKDKNAAAAAASTGTKPPMDDAVWCLDKLTLNETQRRAWQLMRSQWQSWTTDVQKYVAVYGEIAAETDDFEHVAHHVHPQPHAKVDENSHKATTTSAEDPTTTLPTSPSPPPLPRTTAQKTERALDERYRALIRDLDSLLAPLLHATDSRLMRFLQTRFLQHPALATVQAQWQIQLFVDACGQELPWESLPFLQQLLGRGSSSHVAKDHAEPVEGGAASAQVVVRGGARDFSVHLLGHRLSTASSSSTTPSSTALTVPASSWRITVDPLKEDISTPPQPSTATSPSTARTAWSHRFVQLQSKLPGGNKFLPLLRPITTPTAATTTAATSGAMLSLEDILLHLDTAGILSSSAAPANDKNAAANASSQNKQVALMAAVLGRLASSLVPHLAYLATLNLEKLRLFVFWDRGHNDTSFRRQNSADVLASPSETSLVQPALHTVALLSLAGVSCIASHVHATPLASQMRHVEHFWATWTGLSPLQPPPAGTSTSSTTGASASAAKGAAKGSAAASAASTAANGPRPYLHVCFATDTVVAPTSSTSSEGLRRWKSWQASARVVYGVAPLLYAPE